MNIPSLTARRYSNRFSTAAVCFVGLLLGGCATAPRDAGFSDVSAATEQRTGYALAWTRDAEEDRLVNDVITDLLAEELTLEEAVQVALLNNRGLQATYEELGIARGQLIHAGLPNNPVFSAEVFFPDAGTVAELVLTEDLISIFTIPLRRKIEGNQFEATKLRVTDQVVHVVAEVKRAYFDYLASKQLVELLQQVVQSTKASYMAQERLREAGNTRQLDVLRERALYEEAKVALNQAVEALIIARERLNVVMNLNGPYTAWETPARLPEVPVPAFTAATPDAAATNRGVATPPSEPLGAMTADGAPGQMGPEETEAEWRAEQLAGGPTNEQLAGPAEEVLGTAEAGDDQTSDAVLASLPEAASPERFAQIERLAVERSLPLAATRELIEAQAARLDFEVVTAAFPFLDAGLRADHSAEGEWAFGPALVTPIPIFDWGQAAYPREASRLRQRLEAYAALATTVRATARTLEARLQTTKARVTYHREVVLPLHAALVQEAQLQYNAMQITPFQLLQIKRQQIQAGIAYVTALLDYWRARTDLEQLIDGSLPAAIPVPNIGAGLGGVGLRPQQMAPMVRPLNGVTGG